MNDKPALAIEPSQQTIRSVACSCGTAGIQWKNGVGYVPMACPKCGEQT